MENAEGNEVILRDVVDDDVDLFFDHQRDPKANFMAAFTAPNPNDRTAFEAHFRRIRADQANVNKAILWNGDVVGSAASFMIGHRREVCYWIARERWGNGIATRALLALLKEIDVRPLYAGAAKDNAASIRVLEKCGFRLETETRGYSNARGEEIDEVVMRLDG